MDATPHFTLTAALARDDLDAAHDVLRTCALGAARNLDDTANVEDAFQQYLAGSLLKKTGDCTAFRKAVVALLDKCPTDKALTDYLRGALHRALQRMRYHAGPNKKKRRRLRDQVRSVAEQSPETFQCEAHQKWPVGLAGWPDAKNKGCLRASGRSGDLEVADDEEWPEKDRPPDLPMQPDSPDYARVPPYPVDALAVCMAWMLAHKDRFVEGALLARWLWLEFCRADAVAVTSADRWDGTEDGASTLAERWAAADDADTRVWEYEDAAALFVCGLPTDRMRAVWFQFVLPAASGKNVGLVAVGESLGVSHATVDNDAKAVVARLRDFVRVRGFRSENEVVLLLRACQVLSSAAREE